MTAASFKTNVTPCFSANQALLAAKAGASYISPFLGRPDDPLTAPIALAMTGAGSLRATDSRQSSTAARNSGALVAIGSRPTAAGLEQPEDTA